MNLVIDDVVVAQILSRMRVQCDRLLARLAPASASKSGMVSASKIRILRLEAAMDLRF